MKHLSKRLQALETKLSPEGPVLGFWAMTDDMQPMTEEEIEKEIAAMRKAGAPANARIIPMTWLAPTDP